MKTLWLKKGNGDELLKGAVMLSDSLNHEKRP